VITTGIIHGLENPMADQIEALTQENERLRDALAWLLRRYWVVAQAHGFSKEKIAAESFVVNARAALDKGPTP
jgi:hypothetical protein